MFAYGWCVRVAIAIVVVSMTDAASAQDKSDENPVVRELVQQNAQLREEVDLLKSRVTLLEARDKTGPTQSSQATPSEITPSPSGEPPSSETQTPDTPAVSAQAVAMGGHTMEIPGGPALKIRGFLDFNFGSGTVANPLIYPLYPPTIPPTPVHSTFQLGEFDLFLSSRLCSDRTLPTSGGSMSNGHSSATSPATTSRSPPGECTRPLAFTTPPSIMALGSRPPRDDLSCITSKIAEASCRSMR